jgi:hypothetical protein
MTRFLKNADVTGYISQTSVTSSLLKTDSAGKLVAAVAGTDYATPGTIASADKLIREVYNKTGATLTKGTVVYINDGQGNLPAVTKAIASGDSTSAQTFGVVQADITNNNNGYVVVAGGLDNMNTNGLGVGTALYLSSTTAGEYTTVKQSAPNHLVYIGVIVRDHPTQGVIEVRIQNGYELEELHNVAIASLANNHTLVWESATSLWKNKTIAAALGYTPQPQLSGTGFVKIDGTTISYDNSTYLTTTAASSTYLPLAGGTLTGALIGTSSSFSGNITISAAATNGLILQNSSGGESPNVTFITPVNKYNIDANALGVLRFFTENTDGTGGVVRATIDSNGAGMFISSVTAASGIFNNGANSTDGIKVISTTSSSLFTGGIEFIRTTVAGGSKVQPLRDAAIGGVGFNFLVTANNTAEINATYTSALSILNTGAATFSNSVTATSFIRSGGTSAQFLKADGSVDSSTYLTSYTETDTLATVTGRGNTTTTRIGVLTSTAINLAGAGNSGTWVGGVQDATTGWSISNNGIGLKADDTTYATVGIDSSNGILYFGRTTAGGVGTLTSWLEVNSGGVANFIRARPQHNGSNLALVSETLPVAGGTMTGAILMGSTVAAAGNAQPTALSYGLLQGFGTFRLAADTDESQSEFAIITAGYSLANATAANGLAVGYNTLTWKNNTVWHSGNFTPGNYLPLSGGTMTGNITITSADIRSNATSNWTGDPGTQGKIQYHASRWYIVADQDSNRIVQFRRNGTDVSHIANDGTYNGNITGSSSTVTHFSGRADLAWYNIIWGAGSPSHLYSADTVQIQSSAGAIRANIYYDNQDTGYYLDPNNISRIRGLSIAGNASSTSTLDQLGFWAVVDGVPNTTSAIGFKQVSGIWAEHGVTNGAYNTYFTMDTPGRGWVFRRATNGGSDYTAVNVASISNTGHAQFDGSLRAPIFYDSSNTAFYLDPNDTSNLSRLVVNNAISGAALLVGSNSTARVHDDNARKALVINAEFYPALQINAFAGGNTTHGGYITISGNLSSGGYRLWTMGIANQNPGIFSIGYSDMQDGNGHYGIGDAWSGSDAHHGRLIVDTSGNTKIRGMLYVNGTSGGITTGSAVIHAGNIGSQYVSHANNLNLQGLGDGSVNVSNGSSAVYRNENGNGGNLSYAPVLHLGGSDTMWQIQGDYYNSTDLRWRAGYAGTWYAWRQIIHTGNLGSYVLPITGGTLSGTLNFTQPVGLGFANGQYIKDNGTGGLIISSGAAINLNATLLTSNTILNFAPGGATPYANPTGLNCGISFGGYESSSLRQYGVFTELENVGGNYTKLTFNWHTGVRIGASSSYGGTRFYNDAAGNGSSSMIFSVGNGDSNVRVLNNLYAAAFFESSDSKLKTLIEDNYQTKGIEAITPKLYTKNGKIELGYYAQDFVGILDSAISKDNDDILSLSYREVLVAKVYALEQEVEQLKAKLN